MVNLDLETFDKEFDSSLNSVKSLGGRGKSTQIINLCQAPKKPTEKKPNTIGKIAIVPILDKGLHPIHKVAGVITTTVKVKNPDYNPDDENSQEYFWRTYMAAPADSYTCPLTPVEKDLINELYDLSADYGATFSQYGAKKQNLFFMKAFVIKLNSAVSGILYDSLEEPVILQHSSSRFPSAYTDMCNTNDEWGHEWRKQLFVPDGEIANFAVCSTVKEDVGYQVKFEYQSNIKTGRNVDRAKLLTWMDFDINTIGFDTTFVDVDRIKEAIANINAEWDRAEASSTNALDGGISSPTAQSSQPAAAAPSADGVLTL